MAWHPTHEAPFTTDIVIINICAVILWTLTLELTVETINLRRGQRTLGNRKLKGLSSTRRTSELAP